MKLTVLALMTACVAVHAGADTPERELVIVENGQSAYTIVVADEDDSVGRLEQSAKLLADVIEQAAGAKLARVRERDFKGGPAIYLGRTQAARRAGLPVDELKGWSFVQRAVGHDLFLLGEDGSAGIPGAESRGYQGTLRAVTVFLEEQVGVRFVFPGQRGWHVPQMQRLAVDGGLNVAWTPLFDYVIGRRSGDHVYTVANHFFGQTPLLKTYGGHSYYTAVPTEKYAESNPEYFAYAGGKRNPVGNHLCISNPEVQELMLKEMEKQLDLGYAWVELAQTDGYVPCECPDCRELHPDIGERIWIVHRQLAGEMQKRRPGKKIMLLSYGNTGDPPLSFTNFPDNVVIQMCRYTPADFEAWRPFNVIKTVYIYNWGRAWPRVAPRYAVDQVRLFADNDVRGIYLCGGLDQGTAAWGLFAPSYYAFGKALADPSRDAAQLEREFIDAAFGEAAGPMRNFFRIMHGRLEVYALLDRTRSYSFGTMAGDFETHFFPPKVLADMESNLRRALDMARDEDVKARLELVEAEFRYISAVASVFHVYRTYRLMPEWGAFDLLEKQMNNYKATLAWLYPDGKPRPADGLRAPFNGKMVGQGGVPFSWDFDLLREKQVLPGATGTPVIEARRIQLPELDGRFNKPAWEGRQTAELSEIGMGRLRNQSRFRVAYDDENFYVAFEAELDDLAAIDNLTPVGAGGPAWRQENMELVLDGFGERERYCHFMLNPLPDSRFTRRFGYIDDTLHPLFDQFEPWQGPWEYVTAVDRENRRWSAEVRIPFAALGADRPLPGATWSMNLGRTEYNSRGKAVLSLWSPNLETRSFHERSAFGDVLFR